MASASSEAGSTRSQEIEELERFIDSYVLEYQVQGILGDKTDGELDNVTKVPQVRSQLGQGPHSSPSRNLNSSFSLCPVDGRLCQQKRWKLDVFEGEGLHQARKSSKKPNAH